MLLEKACGELFRKGEIFMAIGTLPKELKGEWIWLPEKSGRGARDVRVFARKEFVLESSVPFSELWISAIPSYHVYVNGEHVGYGPAAPTRTKCYGDFYDIAPYLEVGSNVISIITCDMAIPTYSRYPHPPKIWCQVNIGERPVLWTDSTWRMIEPQCYSGGQPRCHAGLEYTESVNLKEFPAGWQLPGFQDKNWLEPRVIGPVTDSEPPLGISHIRPFMWFETDTLEPWVSGKFREGREFTFLSYRNLDGFKAGTYASQTYVHVGKDCETEIQISSDDPFVLFCNNDVVCRREQSVTDPPLFEMHGAFSVGGELLIHCRLCLKKGWNRLLCIQKCSENPMGFMIVFPSLPKGRLMIQREPSQSSMPGWLSDGPLRMPLEFAAPSLVLKNSEQNGFLPLYEHLNDISGYLNYCDYTPDAEPVSSADSLMTGDYVIYNLDEIQYGFPLLDISGSDGDVVDITSGIHLIDDHVKSIGPLGRKTDTIRLTAGSNSWMRLEPRGVKYIMLSVRRAAETVQPLLRFVSYASDSAADTDFICSDGEFNAIWNTAVSSIHQCACQNIIDNPCGRRCQSLAESYIYSMTLYALFGGYNLSAKALAEFAEGQLENGMMQQIAPSGIFSYAPDVSLLWILWLNEHWIASGDAAFRDSMLPALDLLLEFFRFSAAKHDSLLVVEALGKSVFLNETETLDECGMFTPLNALYCRALLSASKLYGDAGMEEKSNACIAQATKLAERIRKLAYDPESGFFADSYYNGKRSGRCSFQTNLIALYSGVAKPSSFEAFSFKFLGDKQELLPLSNTKFFAFVLETLFAFKQQYFAIELIREAYRYNRKLEEEKQANPNPHIFPIIAANYIIRELLGIRAAVPGMGQIYFNPACRNVRSAKGRIPNASGRIVLEWKLTEDEELAVNIDSNHPLDVLPMFEGCHIAGSTFNLGNYVNLLDPDSGGGQPEKAAEK